MLSTVAVITLLQRLSKPGLIVELVHLLIDVGLVRRFIEPVVEVLRQQLLLVSLFHVLDHMQSSVFN